MSIVQKVIVAISLVFSLFATGVVVYTQVVYKKPVPSNEEEFKKMKSEAKKPEKIYDGFKTKKMVINIEQESGKERIRLLNIEAILLPYKENGAATLEENQAIVYDTFNTVAGKMDINDLNSISGKMVLENRLRKAINEKIGEEVIREILFQNFVIQ